MIVRLAAAARALAVLIAIAAALDPSVRSARRVRPEIALVSATPADSVLAGRVADRLTHQYRVIQGPHAAAAGSVIVGAILPTVANTLPAPVHAVLSEPAPATLDVGPLPRIAALDAGLEIEVRVPTGRAAPVTVALRADGMMMDRAVVAPGSHTRLVWTPSDSGLRRVSLVVEENDRMVVVAEEVVDVVDSRWRILVVDPRPSWTSTFVRRALESDPRFVVESRITLSRGIAAEAGQPAATLADARALAPWDVIVVGAAGALTAAETRGLDRHLRSRGGAAIVLLDDAPDVALGSLVGVDRWSSAVLAEPTPTLADDGDTLALRVSEAAWPASMPTAARAVAVARFAGREQPVVWSVPVGAGRITVSGALDAWRFRDVDEGFARFWRGIVGDAAAHATTPLEAALGVSIAAPGERVPITLVVRDALLDSRDGPQVTASGFLTRGEERTPIRLWPDPLSPGRFTGAFRAPNVGGPWRVVLSDGGARTVLRLVVDSLPVRAHFEDRELLVAHATAHGGIAVAASDLDLLVASLDQRIASVPRDERWHPMRSAWWVLPFVLLLSAEWWWRRRRGAR